MEAELNIAKILKDKPEGISLYSPVFGGCVYKGNCDNCIEVVTNNCYFFNEKGHYITNGVKSENGECLLFPSNEMRDWSKFAWKRGDILVSNDGKSHVIFNKWDSDNYDSFYGKHYLNNENKNPLYYKAFICTTEMYSLENKDAAKIYINAIEERLGGKLNFKTLEIEKTQLEFKDGDILSNLTIHSKLNGVFIFKNYNENKNLNYYIGIDESGVLYNGTDLAWCSKDANVRYAIEEEKQRLFKALATVGKHWNSEKKVIEDIKTEYQFKPFEKVLVRENRNDVWRAAFFSHIKCNDSIYKYMCNCLSWKQCIPYEGNESLLGTTKDVEK